MQQIIVIEPIVTDRLILKALVKEDATLRPSGLYRSREVASATREVYKKPLLLMLAEA